MNTEIRELWVDQEDVRRLLALMQPGDSVQLGSIPAGARIIKMDSEPLVVNGKVRICVYEIDVPGPAPTYTCDIGDSVPVMVSHVAP